MTVFLVLIRRAGSAESGGRPSGIGVGVSAPVTGVEAPIPADVPDVFGADIVLAIRAVALLFPGNFLRSSSSSSSSEKRTRPTRLTRELSDRTLPPSSERDPVRFILKSMAPPPLRELCRACPCNDANKLRTAVTFGGKLNEFGGPRRLSPDRRDVGAVEEDGANDDAAELFV